MEFEFAFAAGIGAHRQTIDRIVRLFGIKVPYFLSDESSLLDLGPLPDGVDPFAAIREVFGIDVCDIEDGNLVRIAERIDAGA